MWLLVFRVVGLSSSVMMTAANLFLLHIHSPEQIPRFSISSVSKRCHRLKVVFENTFLGYFLPLSLPFYIKTGKHTEKRGFFVSRVTWNSSDHNVLTHTRVALCVTFSMPTCVASQLRSQSLHVPVYSGLPIQTISATLWRTWHIHIYTLISKEARFRSQFACSSSRPA